MLPELPNYLHSPKLGSMTRIGSNTPSSTESDSSLSTSSLVDYHSLPLAYLVPSNRPACSAILNAHEGRSTYHSKFVTEIEYRGYPYTPCFELALGGLSKQEVGWRIGTGCTDHENEGVELLLVTTDDAIASVHASFGWTIHKPGLLLTILNQQQKSCTINGREFSEGSESIPLENTILIGDCAFTLLFKPRTRVVEGIFQTELQKYVARLISMRGCTNDPSSTKNRKKRDRGADSAYLEDKTEDLKRCKAFKEG
jgi:hypothetical protein